MDLRLIRCNHGDFNGSTTSRGGEKRESHRFLEREGGDGEGKEEGR